MSSDSLPCVPIDTQEHNKQPTPIPTSAVTAPKSCVPDDILTTECLVVRHDAHRSPLQRPYDGPYGVISKSEQSFCVRIGNREEHISIDRLKPAHLKSENLPPVAQPPRRGRPPSNPPGVSRYGRILRQRKL